MREGVHFLADGTISMKPLSSGTVKVVHEVYLYNGGTDACKQSEVLLLWPELLKKKVESGQWTGIKEPFVPGSTATHTGEWNVDISFVGLQAIKQTKVSVRCKDPKSSPLIFTPQFEMGTLVP
jgi:hypothetical protein